MVAPWVLDEMKTADLRDKRLNNRLREGLSQLGGHPTASIPAACGGHAEMTAAHRLFDNEQATSEAILQPHVEATRQRIALPDAGRRARRAATSPLIRKEPNQLAQGTRQNRTDGAVATEWKP